MRISQTFWQIHSLFSLSSCKVYLPSFLREKFYNTYEIRDLIMVKANTRIFPDKYILSHCYRFWKSKTLQVNFFIGTRNALLFFFFFYRLLWGWTNAGRIPKTEYYVENCQLDAKKKRIILFGRVIFFFFIPCASAAILLGPWTCTKLVCQHDEN